VLEACGLALGAFLAWRLKLGAWGFPRLALDAFYFYYTTISKKF